MDGVADWTCSKWSHCRYQHFSQDGCILVFFKVIIEIILRYISYFLYRDGAEIVHCNGNYGHNYPFEYEYEPYIGGTRILWNFMKNHKRNQR